MGDTPSSFPLGQNVCNLPRVIRLGLEKKLDVEFTFALQDILLVSSLGRVGCPQVLQLVELMLLFA